MYQLALLFAILATVQGQVISNGVCDFSLNRGAKSIEIKSNEIDEIKFFEIERIKNTWNTGHCTSLTAKYTNETSISIVMNEVVDHKLIKRTAKYIPDKYVAFYTVAFEDFTSNFSLIPLGKYFGVIYACSNVGQTKHEYAWVASLNNTLTASEKNATRTFIDHIKLNNATWVETSHTADSCRSGGTKNIKLSAIIVLIIGFQVSRGL